MLAYWPELIGIAAVCATLYAAHAKTIVNKAVELSGHSAVQEFAEHANATLRQDPDVVEFGSSWLERRRR